MINILESVVKRLTEAWRSEEPSGRRDSFRCDCGRPVYFRNSLCLGCRVPLGYEPELLQVRALLPGPKPDTWRLQGKNEGTRLWRRCENFDSPAGCNWLVAADDEDTLCVRPECSRCAACHLTRELLGATNHGAERTFTQHVATRLLSLCHVAPCAAQDAFYPNASERNARRSILDLRIDQASTTCHGGMVSLSTLALTLKRWLGLAFKSTIDGVPGKRSFPDRPLRCLPKIAGTVKSDWLDAPKICVSKPRSRPGLRGSGLSSIAAPTIPACPAWAQLVPAAGLGLRTRQ